VQDAEDVRASGCVFDDEERVEPVQDAEDVRASSCVFDEEERVEPAQGDRVDVEQVAGRGSCALGPRGARSTWVRLGATGRRRRR
jgi:hypothetical protein